MFIEIYYFPFLLEKSYKIKTLIDSIKTDLEKFSIYFFNKKLENNENIIFWINNNDDIFIPKFIFQFKWNLDKLEQEELINIFLSNGYENFIINSEWLEIKNNKFLNIHNIKDFFNKTPSIFEKFIKNYKKYKILDKTNKEYIEFIKTYNLFLFLNYSLLKTYKNIKLENKELKKIQTDIIEYTSYIKLLDKRLDLNKENLRKTIVIYSQFLYKIINILKNIDKKV